MFIYKAQNITPQISESNNKFIASTEICINNLGSVYSIYNDICLYKRSEQINENKK